MRTPNNLSKRAATSAKPTVAPIVANEATGLPEPEFMRVEGTSQKFGPSRGWFYKGIREGWFESVLLRQPGAKNGIRLLHVASVRAYLEKQMSSGIERERSDRAAGLRKAALAETSTPGN